MGKQLRNRALIILGVIAAAAYFTFPLSSHINLGLDLKGGMHLILKVDTEKLEPNAKSDAVVRAIEILRNRIDSLGAGEPIIQRQGESEILVQLPGITNREKALAVIGRVAQLEFHIVKDDPELLKQAVENQKAPAGYILKHVKREGNEAILLEEKVALSGETIADARVDFDQTGFGQPHIAFRLNAEGTKKFGVITQTNVNHRLAILLDGEVLSAPNIQEPILGGNGVITGQFSFEEASILALALRSGALPAPMHVEEERTIGPLLGKDSIEAGIRATIYGGILVFLFMLVYYLVAGAIADIALCLNLLLIFGSMGFLNAMLPESQITLTLPGIAGIILTLGMAVDANVLINERIREEINNGRPLQIAINNGYNTALRAIIDSNITSLIAAFMLFQFGSGPIKGFAVTLSLGLVASLFTSVFVTRTIFSWLIQIKLLKKLPMLSFFSETKINFFGLRYLYLSVSTVLIITSFVTLFSKGESAYGIDFAGGQIQEFKFDRPIPVDDLRSMLKGINLDTAVIQQFDQNPQNVIIRTPEESHDLISKTLKDTFPDNKFEVLRIEKVGPVVGKALRRSAVLAILFALGGILIYIGFRFKHFDFAAAGVIAILHDVIVTFGILLLFNRTIDLLVITALLTIAGYSINDTIIIYDRVRENLMKSGKRNLQEVINFSINQTLGRTILTTVATLLAVIALYLKGGEVLNTFALCILIGFITGTYSTIYVVSPLVLLFQKKK